MLADGATRRRYRAEVDDALARLRYGGIGVNVWTGANFALGVPSWGAFPGNTLDNVRSGIGVVHNTMLFDHPQKSIVRGPFRLLPTPVWFADHRTWRTRPARDGLRGEPDVAGIAGSGIGRND